LLLKVSAIESVGLLEESYFFYWEDIDYSRRLDRAGWRLAVAERARVLHREGGTISGGEMVKSISSDEFMVAGMVRFFGTHGGRRWPLTVFLRMVGIAINRVRRGQINRLPSLIGTARTAFRDVRLSRKRVR